MQRVIRFIAGTLITLVAGMALAAGGKVTSPTGTDVFEGVRQTYDGPLSLATDNMVWNITRDNIVVRMTVSPDHAWSVAGPTPPPKPPVKGSVPDPVSDFINAGRWNPETEEAQADMIKAFKKEHNMK